MEIKEAAEKHIPGMLKLWMEFMYFNRDADPVNTKSENVLEKVTGRFKTMILSANALVLISIDGEDIIGYSISEINPKSALQPEINIGYIYDFAVTSSRRKQGIGRQMLQKIKAWFESRNVSDIELSALTRKMVDKSFWNKQGFSGE